MSFDVALTEARTSLGELAARAEYGGETVYLTRHGRRAAAVVSAAAAELLEQLEDLLDAEAVAQVQNRLAAGTEGRRRLVTAEPSVEAYSVDPGNLG
ncbi:MAG TPA: type II toxin-antitoxin system prevent-host-death family antitoxin [Pseudonocardiaceae bacterium]|nr:type II toxin-antitoxin system prevent-host-death family antitoxin [Pseudonocardiaceae bacterium]